MIVAVVGKGRNCPEATSLLARQAGAAIAKAGHTLVTGGLEGVMKAAAFGAADLGGQVLGLVPHGREPDPGFPGTVLRTGVNEWVRNVMIGSCCDAMLACYGSHGTLQEVAIALDREIPVVSFGTQEWAHLGLDVVYPSEIDLWLNQLSGA